MSLPLRLVIPRGFKAAPIAPRTFNWAPAIPRTLRRPLHKAFQQRCYAQLSEAERRRTQEELKNLAKAASNKQREQLPVPARILIYHGGVGRTTFLAMLKITTLFVGAFFCFVVTPSYIKAGKTEWETASVFLCGLAPVLFVAYTTAPFVTHMHLHVPAAARTGWPRLERWVAAAPPDALLTLTTMSAISKPRYSAVRLADLRPAAGRRFGLVNYVRDAAPENARRKWYNLPAVRCFYVQDDRPLVKAGRHATRDGQWMWDGLKHRVGKTA